MIEAARAFGYKVFYGDATRLDLLRTAGAATAKVLVIAVDDTAQSLKIVDLAREHFPQLELVARARDVTHWNELRDRGVMRVERELFESSLRSGRTVLEVLGFTPHEARAQAMRFRRHNLAAVRADVPAPQGPGQGDRRGQAGTPAAGGADGAGACRARSAAWPGGVRLG